MEEEEGVVGEVRGGFEMGICVCEFLLKGCSWVWGRYIDHCCHCEFRHKAIARSMIRILKNYDNWSKYEGCSHC